MNSPVQLLLVEDDPGDAEVVRRLLSKSPRLKFQVEWVDNLEGALLQLRTGTFDVLLLDLCLHGTRDLEGLTSLRKASFRVPIVVVTDLDVENVALRALHRGAQDYLIKGTLTTDSLVHSVHYATQRYDLVRNLSEAQLMLEAKNRRLAKLYRTAHEFVDNVSHEFRTPLTVIKEYVSLVKDGVVGEVSDEQRHMLAIVEDRADDLNTMVDDMLDGSKLEAGLLGIYRKRCDPADFLDRTRPAIERKAAVKGVELVWECEKDLPAVYCDPEKAWRVLINLTTNAIKFCGRPGQVRVVCRRETDSDGVAISVTDNGPGIRLENQRVIFRRFKQLDESVRSSTKGFGLGLNIAKELAEANLGELGVVSVRGCGSTFSFTLPAAEPAHVMRRYLHRISRIRHRSPFLSLVRARIAATATEAAADDADEFLSFLLRYNDLLLRLSPTAWLICVPIPESAVDAFLRRAESMIADSNRNRLGDALADIDFQAIKTSQVSCQNEIEETLHAELHSQEAMYA